MIQGRNPDSSAVTPNRPIEEQTLQQLFTQLSAHDVEQFYAAFQLFSCRRQNEQLAQQIERVRQEVVDNEAHMLAAAPPTLALATLVQLQAAGVEDIDLLDRMLARGEEWLDQAMLNLQRCQELGMLDEGITHWCEHALEGAYDWMSSMPMDASNEEYQQQDLAQNSDGTNDEAPQDDLSQQQEPTITEDQLLRKLMSDDDGQVPPATDSIEKSEPPQEQIPTKSDIAPDAETPQQEQAPASNDATPDAEVSQQEQAPASNIADSDTKEETKGPDIEHEAENHHDEISPDIEADDHKTPESQMAEEDEQENQDSIVSDAVANEESESEPQPESESDAEATIEKNENAVAIDVSSSKEEAPGEETVAQSDENETDTPSQIATESPSSQEEDTEQHTPQDEMSQGTTETSPSNNQPPDDQPSQTEEPIADNPSISLPENSSNGQEKEATENEQQEPTAEESPSDEEALTQMMQGIEQRIESVAQEQIEAARQETERQIESIEQEQADREQQKTEQQPEPSAQEQTEIEQVEAEQNEKTPSQETSTQEAPAQESRQPLKVDMAARNQHEANLSLEKTLFATLRGIEEAKDGSKAYNPVAEKETAPSHSQESQSDADSNRHDGDNDTKEVQPEHIPAASASTAQTTIVAEKDRQTVPDVQDTRKKQHGRWLNSLMKLLWR